MPELSLRRLGKGLLLIACMQLSACAQQPLFASHDAQPVSIRKAVPVDFAALNLQQLLSYDVYPQGETLHALFAAKRRNSERPYIGYLRSDDNGQSWSTPMAVELAADVGLESTLGNDLQIAANTDSLLAMVQQTGEIHGMGPLLALYSEDEGQTWHVGSNPTASQTDQSHPELTADQQGRFHLVWLDDRDENGYQGVRYASSVDAGLHWDWAQTVDDSSCSCCWNRLKPDTSGQISLLYRDMQPRDMALAQSVDGGKSWQRISTVGEFNWTFDGCPHNGGGLAESGQNLHALAWTGAENKSGLYYLLSTDSGKHWSAPQAMGAGSLAFHSDIAVADEHVLVIWDAMGADGSSVMLSESLDKGQHWQQPKLLSTPGSAASFPRIVATDSGFLAVWVEQKPDGFKQWMTAILEQL